MVYETLFDGLRGWYASYATERSYAGFSAAMALSFLFCVNLISLVTICLLLLDGNLHRVGWLIGNKLLCLLIGVGIATVHVRYAKSTGRYYSTEPPRTPRWKRPLILYCLVTAVFLIGALLGAAASRSGASHGAT